MSVLSRLSKVGATATLAAALVIAGGVSAQAETVIDTNPVAPDTGSFFSSFGPYTEATATYGQTITAPVGETTLNGFGFKLQGDIDFSFRAQVYAWDAATNLPTGPALFTSDELFLTGTDPDVYQDVAVATPSTVVVSGQQYVLLLTTLLDPQTSTNDSGWLAVDGNTYAGGDAVYSNQETYADMLASWDGTDTGLDFAFTASFGEVIPAAAVTAVAPATGTTAGGTSVVITGTQFNGATGVFFGAVAATSFTVDSATQITAVAPAQAAGAVNITVVGATGTSAIVAADTYTYVAPVAAAQLAATGSDVTLPAALALVLMLAGAFALVLKRRRRA